MMRTTLTFLLLFVMGCDPQAPEVPGSEVTIDAEGPAETNVKLQLKPFDDGIPRRRAAPSAATHARQKGRQLASHVHVRAPTAIRFGPSLPCSEGIYVALDDHVYNGEALELPGEQRNMISSALEALHGKDSYLAGDRCLVYREPPEDLGPGKCMHRWRMVHLSVRVVDEHHRIRGRVRRAGCRGRAEFGDAVEVANSRQVERYLEALAREWAFRIIDEETP